MAQGIWPAYEVLSTELEAYVENIEKVDNLKRGDEGKIKANAAKFIYGRRLQRRMLELRFNRSF
jgi:hypothetical protein